MRNTQQGVRVGIYGDNIGTMMHTRYFAPFFAALFILAILLFPRAALAADFGAEIVDVYGQALITPKATGKTVSAAKGMKLAPGDAVETKAKAELELLYDDGNITRIDEKTKITITRMSVEDDKSKQTLLNLTVGRVKNSVSKLSREKSRFEVQTMSAVAGVTGTPPWIVAAIGEPGKNQKVEVDLLPEKPGVATPTAGVFVKGVTPGAAMVTLTPGTRTFASAGAPPAVPVPISPARLQQLQTAMKIATPPQVQEQKKKELEQKIKEEPKKEEKKTEEKKGEDKKEEAKKEGSKQEASKEEPTGGKKEPAAADNNETKTNAATGGDGGKAADTGGGKTDSSAASSSSGGAASPADDGAGTSKASSTATGGASGSDAHAGNASTGSGSASGSTPDTPAAPSVAPSTAAFSVPSAGVFAGGFAVVSPGGVTATADPNAMMNHLSNNVSVGNVVTPGTQAGATAGSTPAAALPGANQVALPAATSVRVLVNIVNK